MRISPQHRVDSVKSGGWSRPEQGLKEQKRSFAIRCLPSPCPANRALFVAAVSAPARRSAVMHPTCPARDAACRAVEPLCGGGAAVDDGPGGYSGLRTRKPHAPPLAAVFLERAHLKGAAGGRALGPLLQCWLSSPAARERTRRALAPQLSGEESRHSVTVGGTDSRQVQQGERE